MNPRMEGIVNGKKKSFKEMVALEFSLAEVGRGFIDGEKEMGILDTGGMKWMNTMKEKLGKASEIVARCERILEGGHGIWISYKQRIFS